MRFPGSVPVGRRGAVALHFISYSRVDAIDFAHDLCQALRSHERPVEVFIDDDIPLGAEWDEAIQQAIDDCGTFLFVLTHDSVNPGSGSLLELKRAVNRKKLIVPLRLHDDAPEPMLLGNRQHLPVGDDVDAAVEKLLQRLQWSRTPEGRMRELRDQRADAERQLARAHEPDRRDRWVERIVYLDEQLKAMERDRDLEDEDHTARRRIGQDRSRDRAEGVARIGRRRPKVVNDPPRFVTDYFQDRHHETALLEEYLRNDAVRLVVVSGPENLGKTAMTCRLLDRIVRDEPLDGEPVELDGVAYFGADKGPVSGRDLLAGLAALLPSDASAKLVERLRQPGTSIAEQLRTVLNELDDQRLIVLLDAAQELVDPVSLQVSDVELDQLLRGLLDPPQNHRVTVVMTTRRRPEPLMSVQRSAQRRLALDEGLTMPHAMNLLRALDSDGRAGLQGAAEDALEAACHRTGGNPFALEMLYTLLKNDPTTSLAKLLSDTEGLTPEQVADEFLAREAIAVLDATERAVVEALAIYQVKVRAGAVNYLLEPFLDGVDCGPALEHLAATQLVRRTDEHYQLPQKYWFSALDRVPFGTPGAPEADSDYTQVALLRRAAQWFEDVSWPPEAWQVFGDLTPQIYQFRLLIRAQDYLGAAGLLLEISPHVLRWGHARELLEAHRGLVSKLVDDPALAHQNMGSLGIILFDLRRYDEAIDCFERAKELAEPLDDPMAVNRYVLDVGSAQYQLGRTEEALDSYRTALQAAAAAEDREEQRWALAGIALCESDLGHFELAVDHAKEALEIIRDLEEPLPEDSVLEIELLAYLGNFQGQRGLYELAVRELERALKHARGEGYRHGEVQCLIDLAELRVDLGEYQDGAKLARRALELNQERLGEAQLAREAGHVLALASLCDGAQAEARMTIDRAAAYRPSRWTQPARALQGIVMLRQREQELARTAFLEAVEEAEAFMRGGTCYFALDALGLAQLGMACCGEEEQAERAAGTFWDARGLTRADGVVSRVSLLLDQLALAGKQAVVEAVRPYAEGLAGAPPPGRGALEPQPDASHEPAA